MLPPDEPNIRGKQGELAEFQGLYGSFHVAELLLQKIWLWREFDQDGARTTAGEKIEILHPGIWNRLAGPDFRDAKLRIGGREVRGDVEVHFRSEAWIQHGHDRDPGYDDVVLHVVLFPPGAHAEPAKTRSGRDIAVLAIVDLLWHDLEEYATDDAVAALSNRDPWPALERLLALEPESRNANLLEAAMRRWQEKCHFASLRVRRLGWADACHQSALEILGYRVNRAAMLKIGTRFPWETWSTEIPGMEALLAAAVDSWSMRGVRPANHPRQRLQQYRSWTENVRDWPKQLLHAQLPAGDDEAVEQHKTARFRRKVGMPALREWFSREVCGGALSGTRLDTWIVNLALPFLASTDQGNAARALWLAWYPGDAPDAHAAAARQLLAESRQPLSNGMLQAIIGLQLDRWRADGPALLPESGIDD